VRKGRFEWEHEIEAIEAREAEEFEDEKKV